MKKCLPFLAALFVGTAAATPPTVQMLPASGEMQPGTTLELRFPVPLANQDQLGPASESPLVFEPPMPGRFTWLSTRSGTFAPEGPLPLGSTWSVRVAEALAATNSGLKDWRASVRTPDFGVTACASSGTWDKEDVAPESDVKIAFQSAVAADAGFFRFIDASGRELPATVRPVKKDDYFPVPPDAGDWNLRWKLARDPSAAKDTDSGYEAQLVVTPASPLPAGQDWKLVVAAGFSSKDGKLKLATPYEVPLGNVQPFGIKTIEANNYINSGPTLHLEFNRALAPDITGENADKFFVVDPKPEGLKWEVDYGDVVARGKFARDMEYKVAITPGVLSSSGQAFEGSREIAVRFGPVPPRLYLPEMTMSQALAGRRIMPIRSVNLKDIRIKATLLPSDKAARALSAFVNHDEWSYSEENKPVPIEGLTGKVICDQTVGIADTSMDAPQTTDLDWTKLLGGKKAGTILLELQGQPLAGIESKTPAVQALVQLSDLGILWQKAGPAVRIRAVSNATAKPLPAVEAKLLDENFNPVATGKTDADGSAQLVFASAPRWLIVRKGDDSCVIGMGPTAQTLRMGNGWYSGNWEPGGIPSQTDAALFADRPLYQPGETVHVKGFVRKREGGELRFVPNQEYRLQLQDASGTDAKELFPVVTDEHGAFDASFTAPSGPMGRFYASLAHDGDELGGVAFLLAEYQPDAFEVKLEAPTQIPAGGPAPRATVSGSYFFGGELKSADVRWTLRYMRASFYPEGFGDFRFIGSEDGDDEDAKPLTLRGEEKLASNGTAGISPVLPAPELAPFRGVLTAEVTDINQQTVSAEATFTREASDFYLGVENAEPRVVRKGDNVPLRVVAVKTDGQPLEKPVEITVNVWRSRYNVVREQGAGGAMTFRRETIEEPLLEKQAKTVIPSKATDGQWSVDQDSLALVASGLGHHRVRISARDAGGREVATEYSFYVSGEGETTWDYRSPYQIDMVADKNSYRAGESARILVKTPIAGEALVNVERGSSILRSLRIPLEGNAPAIEIPLGESDAPNVTVTLVVLRGSDQSPRKFPVPEFRYGSCDLAIEQPETHLAVEVKTGKAKVMPGEEVATTINVKDHLGRPVPKANVTFYAVDDGILSLGGFSLPDPGKTLNAAVPLAVLTGLSWADLMAEDPEDLHFSNKGYLIGGGGPAEGLAALRRNFPGTACWLPALVTDEHGNATARFKAPDALTRYRLVAVAASGPDTFGAGESAVAIAKPLMILPSLGQFANAGDHLIARAVVRNETGRAGKVEVTLETPQGKESRTVEVAQNGSVAVDFPLAPVEPGPLELAWTAKMTDGTFSDRAQTSLRVGSPMLELRETYLSDLSGKTNNLLEGINPQVAEGRGMVSVTVANTRLAGLSGKARYLAEYPYGCVEQTASALVPWLVMPELGPFMPGFARGEAETTKTIDDTVAKLFKFLVPGSGMAFWPGGNEASPYASAWAAIVLQHASRQGKELPKEYSKLLAYLEASLRGLKADEASEKLSDRAFAAYALALAGQPQAAYNEMLYRRRSELPMDARAVLAMAMAKSKGSRKAIEELLREDKQAPGDLSPFGGGGRDRAIRLLAMVTCDPKSKQIAPLLAEVVALGPQSRGETTQSNAWALLALAEYRAVVEKPKEGSRSASGTIVAGTKETPFSLSTKEPAFAQTFAREPGETLAAANPAAAQLYGETRFTVFPPLGKQPRQDRGFAVSRSYKKIAPDGSLVGAENLRVGDRVVVTLRVETSHPAFFVAVSDPLPAILEAVNPEFISRGVGATEASEPSPVSFCEIRADRVNYFCNALPSGAFNFEYLARVRTAGEAVAGATKAEAMYRPERFGLGDAAQLSAQPATP